jgi:O-antigen/teichoic acid export membrane protein
MKKLIKEFIHDCVNQSNVNSLVVILLMVLIFAKENVEIKLWIFGGGYVITLILVWSIVKYFHKRKELKKVEE